MRREIGSEFEMPNEQLTPHCTTFDEYELTFSGRTSIQLSIQDLLLQRKIQGAWLPSYCCASMIQPFSDTGVPVQFYEVSKSEVTGICRKSFTPQKNEVVLSMGYFGFFDSGNNSLIESCVTQDIPVIEDCTHSLLSINKTPSTDYQIASLRKWFPLASGGYVKKKSKRILWSPIKPNEQLIQKRLEAMKKKTDYLQSSSSEEAKNRFLTMYRECNQGFASEYQNIGIDFWSRSMLKKQNIDVIRQRRRENASILLEGLYNIPDIKPLFQSLGANDCPLFVPVVSEKRDSLQKWLAGEKIYCPAHWPKPCTEANSKLYDVELSLICDQRYDEDDMHRILDTLRQFPRNY